MHAEPRHYPETQAGRVVPLGASIHDSALLAPGRTKRDAASWSKGKFCEFLVGIVVESEAGHCQISELKQLEGEASYSKGKGKLIFFYEWNIKLGWKGNRGLRGQVGLEAALGQIFLIHHSFIQQVFL